MGVPSIVVLLLVPNLQEWLKSFPSGVGENSKARLKKILLFVWLKATLICPVFFFPFLGWFAPFSLAPVLIWIQCRLWGCPVKQTRHAWIQASGVRIRRCGQVGSGEYSFLKLFYFFVQFIVFLSVFRCNLLDSLSDRHKLCELQFPEYEAMFFIN